MRGIRQLNHVTLIFAVDLLVYRLLIANPRSGGFVSIDTTTHSSVFGD